MLRLISKAGFVPVGMAAALVLLAPSAHPETKKIGPLEQGASKLVSRALGDPDPALPVRLSRELGSALIRRMMYSSDSAARLMAIDAAGCVGDPWDLLPYLGALMVARDRQTASRASKSLIDGLTRSFGEPANRFEVVPAEAAQLGSELAKAAVDARLDIDIRIAALSGLRMLRAYDESVGLKPGDISGLLKDEDPSMRRAALTAIQTPVDKELLSLLAGMVSDERDPGLRGQAAALLCENALAHGAKAPSKDLSDLLTSVLGNGELPADSIGPIAACLNRFPSGTGAALVDIASSHPDPSVGRFVKGLKAE